MTNRYINQILVVGYELTANRLVCKNGMVAPRSIARLSMRHFQNADLELLRKELDKSTGQIEPTVKRWHEWVTLKPTESRVQAYFEHVGIGKRLSKQIYDEAISESQRMGVWGLMNVLTAYISHDLKVRNEANRELSTRNKEQELVQPMYTFQ